MSLLDVQNFLARIYTDEILRHEFASAPQRIGRENNLTEKEIAELIVMLPGEIDYFADTLLRKRLHEVKKLLPLTQKTLAEEFEKLFFSFASRFTPATIKKHLEDAIAFADFLQTRDIKPLWARDAARFERTKLNFNNSNKPFVNVVFDYDIKELDRRTDNSPIAIRRKKTLVIWMRYGKWQRYFIM